MADDADLGEIRGLLPGHIPGAPLTTEGAQDTLGIVLEAVNSTIGGMIITDLNGCVRFANRSFGRMFDYALEDIIGVDAATLFTSREVRTLTDVIAMIDISREATEEYVVQRRDGSRFIVEVAASNVTSSAGQLVGHMASFVDITRRKEIEIDREQLVRKLRDALSRIKTLRGIIPICASCKKIRDDKGYWKQIECYIQEHSEADFSHGICPDCVERLYRG